MVLWDHLSTGRLKNGVSLFQCSGIGYGHCEIAVWDEPCQGYMLFPGVRLFVFYFSAVLICAWEKC